MNILHPEWYGSLQQMLEDLPENRPLYKDSGLWQIRSDDMEQVLYQQEGNETLLQFIERAFAAENVYKDAFKDQIEP